MRTGIRLLACMGIVGWLSMPAALMAQGIDVSLLGTGTPAPVLNRFGPGTLVRAGGQTILIDAGRGVLQRLSQLKVPYSEIDALLLTHLHSDHTVGIPDLWLTGWLMSGRQRPLQVLGPPGTAKLFAHLREAYAFDIDLRVSDDGMPLEGAGINVIEVTDGFTCDAGEVRVKAFEVDHRPVVPAFGYRIDFKGNSVLLSGDTRYSQNLIKNADGVDLLIHEVAGATESALTRPSARRAFEHHTTGEEAGRIFATIKPGLAVYSHIILMGGYELSQLMMDTRKSYAGPLVAGEDLMGFHIEDGRVTQVDPSR